MGEFSPQIEDAIASLCRKMALEAVKELATAINELPLPDEHKTSMLFTIEISMLNTTLNGMHPNYSSEVLLARKLEMLRIIKQTFVREANEEKSK